MEGSSRRMRSAVREVHKTRGTSGVLCRLTGLGIALALIWATLAWRTDTPALAAPAPGITGLHVSGNRIVNGGGQPVRLRGVNRTSAEYGCIFNFAIFVGPTDEASIRAMLAWNINAVRIPLNEDCWLDVNTAGLDRAYVGANYRAAVVDYVTRLTSAGIAVILDLHWAAPGTQRATQQLPMPDRDHAPAFWTSVASAFKTNTAVIFDLYNEPYPDGNRDTLAAWQCVRDGTTGPGSCPQVGYAAAGMQELLNAVRATGATNLVMVPGVAYTGVLSRWIEYKPTDPLDPPNLAASVHIYPPGSQCSTPACWEQYLAPIAAGYPLIAGEIGQTGCAHDRIDGVIDWLESRKQHYLAWAWWTEPCNASPYYGLITDYATGAPSPGYGQGYKDRLAGLVQPPGFSVSASAAPTTVAPGGSVAIQASVTSAAASRVVVDVEVHDAANRQVFQRYFEDEAFGAGQTRTFSVSWPVPATAQAGTYTVQVGVFSPDWGTEHAYISDAARVSVATAPAPTGTPVSPPAGFCSPRPNVLVTTTVVGPGQLSATIATQSLPATPSNSLRSIQITRIDNALVRLNGGAVAVGPTVLLPPGTPSLTLLLDRHAPGFNPNAASTVSFVVHDACGAWPGFIGGGPLAF